MGEDEIHASADNHQLVDPRTAYDWASQLARPIIYKPLDGVWHADEGQVRVIYTSPVEDLHELL
ncbi:MAG TPA: hypothetical protein VGM14_30320, partial [Streptosporangiaceae bacterium]